MGDGTVGCIRIAVLTGVCLVAAACQSQVSPSPTLPQEAGRLDAGATTGNGECAAIAAHDARLAPLTALCRFARSYRQALPNFVCDETVTAHDDRPLNTLAPRVMTDVVTYEDGEEEYSDITIDGMSAASRYLTSRGGVPLNTSGEFGNDLVALFRAPVGAEFRFAGEQKVHGTRALVFEFHLPAAKNTFWSLRDASGATVFPEYRGTMWLAEDSGGAQAFRSSGQASDAARLLKMELQPVNLGADFFIDSAQVTMDFASVSLGDAGRFLLPARSETWACVRSELGPVRCARNDLRFHGCRKFAATARIVSEARD